MPIESSLWFEEILELEQGRTIKIKIDDLIEVYDSEFQRIEIYKTKPFGKMLVLDGVIMCTEWDEHAYHVRPLRSQRTSSVVSHISQFAHRALNSSALLR